MSVGYHAVWSLAIILTLVVVYDVVYLQQRV